MKSKNTILVGIDYTKSSENALQYAIKLAGAAHAAILLFHVYETPVAHTYSGVYFVSFNDIDRYNKKRLELYKEKVLKENPGLSISTFTTFTSFKSGVKDLLKKHAVNLVVLGLGSKTKFSRFLYGTTGIDLAGKVNCPVIIVPDNYKEHRIKLNLISIDNKEYLKAPALKSVKEFSRKFKLTNEFVHIQTPDEFLIKTKNKVVKQDKKLKVNVLKSKDLVKGINSYAKANNADLITVFSHKHSVFYNLFNETNTKLVAFGTKLPVVSIHD